MKRVYLLFSGILTATGGILLFACSSKAGFVEDSATDAETAVEASLPSPSDASPSDDVVVDAHDEYVVPDASVACGAAPCAVGLSGWGGTFCAVLSDGAVTCWGANDLGQLGYDTGPDFPHASGVAKRVPNLAGVTQVSVGDGNTCARVSDGNVLCWGAPELLNAATSSDGGDPPFQDIVPIPTRLDLLGAVSNVAVGGRVACAIDAAGVLRCWGQNHSLELGRGAPLDEMGAPAEVTLGGMRFTAVVPGIGRVFALSTAGTLFSWGASTQQGSYGFLLARDTSQDPDGVPALVPFAEVRGVATGSSHGCAITGRYVTCWGANDNGELGRGTFGPQFYLPGSTNLEFVIHADNIDAGLPDEGDVVIDLSVSDGHSCAVMASGRVYCWGANFEGELGEAVEPNVDKSGKPIPIRGISGPAVRVVSTNGATCVLLRTGAVECWGGNYTGQLGRGALDDRAHAHPENVVLPP